MPTYTLTARRNPVKYAAQLFTKFSFDPRIATPNAITSGDKDMYALYTGVRITDPSNYWIAWGGTFDNPVGENWQAYFEYFLVMTDTYAACLAVENTFYFDAATDILYLHTRKPPWAYFERVVNLYSDQSSAFSTAPKDDKNLSDEYYGVTRVRSLMIIPSFSNELSDAISGITKYSNFTIKLHNNDGYFDTQGLEQFFNTPITVSKTSTNAQTLAGFNKIRYGLVSDIAVGYDSVTIKGDDQLYQMKNSVCRVITTDEFPNAVKNINKNIPIGWGTLTGIPLISLYDAAGTYYKIALDKEYITGVSACYDKDGIPRAFSFSSSTGVISSAYDIETANVTGRADSRIGNIIVELLSTYESLPYVSGLWDTTETDAYIALSANIDLYIDGGTTKDAIETALKNDIAFLIQKNNSLLTIRQWGQEYDVFNIPSWTTTGKPAKNFQDAYKYYCSSVRVSYSDGDYIDDTQEEALYLSYKKTFMAQVETVIHSAADAQDLAERWMARFGRYRETLETALGVDTYQINLLDTVNYNPTINGRKYSAYTKYIVKKTNPGQDTLELEGVS